MKFISKRRIKFPNLKYKAAQSFAFLAWLSRWEAGSGPPFRHGPSHTQPKTSAQYQCQCIRLRYPVPYDATTTT
ncbi:hypothetical protein D3C81_607860 [compost metagenome]